MPARLALSDSGFEASFRALLERRLETAANVAGVVSAILSDVKVRGDDAIVEYTARFDQLRLEPSQFRISEQECEAAQRQCDAPTLQALELAAGRIRAYHATQTVEDLWYQDDAGVGLGHRWTSVDAAGLYVPGGSASYPSSVLMNAIPAKVAGVKRLVMVAPTPGGKVSPLVLAAARLAGVDEIYRIGGAQAIAALAFGTDTIKPVAKIVGPGNAYVAEAKRQVFGVTGIDMIAGPSEILVVSDSASDPAWIAADLLSQAEHDAAAQAILITDDKDFAERVIAGIDAQLADLERADTARKSWREHGAVIIVEHLDQAPALIDRIAPEHLELAVADPDRLAARIRHAGAIFLGRHTPEAIGDYVAGPNHVLPTAGSARFSSGLSVFDFLKRTSLIRCSRASLGKIGAEAVRLAEAEGLTGHARSVALRLGKPSHE
ncbi:MAG: histidinol dehydrogenase [Sphingomonadales bacterium]